MEKNLFILAGNGSYDNRGCEAIEKGTIKILRHHFNDPRFVILNFYSSEAQFDKQVSEETDKNITHKKTFIFGRAKPIRALNKVKFFLSGQNIRTKIVYKELMPYIGESKAVLSLGGDNYSFDYKKPVFFTDLDDLVISRNKPMIIWGASVGPFSKNPRYEVYMKDHLNKIKGIFARESLTVAYLSGIGITKNVYRVADPAFLVDAVPPSKDKFDKEILSGAIGINLSHLMANFSAEGNADKWARQCADIIKKIAVDIKRPVYLIPHVSGFGPSDHSFFEKVLSLAGIPEDMVTLLPDNLNFQETKWIIGKMSAFLGSRTHSVISALSSGVPTASLVYSMKGFGINRDFYGNDDFSIGKGMMEPDIIVQKMKELIKREKSIKEQINHALPGIKGLAMDAGKYLKEILR